MANTKISALTANTNPNWSEELVYAYNNANGKMTLNTMKSFIWWAWITTLSSDANIWELSDWFYETTYDLYYMNGGKVKVLSWGTKKQMLFVTSDSWAKSYFGFNIWTRSWRVSNYAFYGESVSSTTWTFNQLWDREWALNHFWYRMASLYSPDSISKDCITQVIDNISWSNTNVLTVSSDWLYAWLTYTVIVNSVSSVYNITLWTWVTNPLNITLPTDSNKKCVITLVATSSTTAIVTWCTMGN